MMHFREDKIREAIRVSGYGYAMERIMKELKKDHLHDWADDDMISVKEVREAWERGSSTSARNSLDNFLQDISEHREPEYLPGSTWVDNNGKGEPWYRTGGGTWMRFGEGRIYDHNAPRFPMKEMKVT